MSGKICYRVEKHDCPKVYDRRVISEVFCRKKEDEFMFCGDNTFVQKFSNYLKAARVIWAQRFADAGEHHFSIRSCYLSKDSTRIWCEDTLDIKIFP